MTVMKLSKKIGKVAAVSGVCPGFIGNRMLSPRQQQANDMIMEAQRSVKRQVDDDVVTGGAVVEISTVDCFKHATR